MMTGSPRRTAITPRSPGGSTRPASSTMATSWPGYGRPSGSRPGGGDGALSPPQRERGRGGGGGVSDGASPGRAAGREHAPRIVHDGPLVARVWPAQRLAPRRDERLVLADEEIGLGLAVHLVDGDAEALLRPLRDLRRHALAAAGNAAEPEPEAARVLYLDGHLPERRRGEER